MLKKEKKKKSKKTRIFYILKRVINPSPRLACIVINRCTKNTTPNLRVMSQTKIEPSFDPSIYEAPRIQPLNRLSPLLSPLYPPRNAGRIDANHIFSQQSTVGRISNRRPIDSSPGDCRGFIIFPSIFSSLKGIHPPLPSPPSSYSIAPCRAKGKYFMEFLVAGTLWARVTTL